MSVIKVNTIQHANGTTALTIAANGAISVGTQSVSGNLSFNSGYGSSAVAYGCRAWVNFDGTNTPAIRASGNVSSITDNGTGDYTINFTTAMPDANYAVMTGPSIRASSDRNSMPTFYAAGTAATTSSFRVRNSNVTESATMHDANIFYLSVLR